MKRLAISLFLFTLLCLPGHALAEACNDGIDNDGDGYTDYPDDTDCTGATDTAELKPTLEGSYDTPGGAWGIYVEGIYAYIADIAGGLQVIDVIDPSAPAFGGSYVTPGGA